MALREAASSIARVLAHATLSASLPRLALDPLCWSLKLQSRLREDENPRNRPVTRRRRIAVVASASGNGKTTVGVELARRLGIPFVELDALVHGPGWSETSDTALRAQVEPIVASEEWVIDGTYQRKLGDLVLGAADTIVWLDLPIRVWLPRLVRRTWRRARGRERLWNANRESLSSLVLGRDSLFVLSFRTHCRRRREWPAALPDCDVRRLRSRAEVERFLAGFAESS